MLNQDVALDFSYTVFGAILRKNLPTFLKINIPGVFAPLRVSGCERSIGYTRGPHRLIIIYAHVPTLH